MPKKGTCQSNILLFFLWSLLLYGFLLPSSCHCCSFSEAEEDEDKNVLSYLLSFKTHKYTPSNASQLLRHKRGFFHQPHFVLNSRLLACLPRLKVFSFKYCLNFLFILPHIVTVDVFIAVDVWLVPARIFLQKKLIKCEFITFDFNTF